MADLTVISAGAIRHSVSRVAQLFEREHGPGVFLDFAPAPKIRERLLGGYQADVVIASGRVLDALGKAEKIVVSSRSVVGCTRMAVMMRKGAVAPDFSGADAFRQALLEADAVVYNEGSSGANAAATLDRLGLRESLGTKIQVAKRGADMIELVVSHPGRVLALGQLTNVMDQVEKGVGVALAGLFPDELQSVTSYELAVCRGSRDPELAGAFVRAFGSAEARKLLAAAGLD